MQKIAILGADGVGRATMIDAIELAYAEIERSKSCSCSDMKAMPVECCESIGMSHSFEGTYYPTRDELAALRMLQQETEWDRITRAPEVVAVEWSTKQTPDTPFDGGRYSKHLGSKSTPPTTKARKAARRRAKAGRKASR